MSLCRTRSDGALYPLREALLFAVLICAIPGFAQQQATAVQTTSASVPGKVTAATGQQTTDNIVGITIKLTAAATGSKSKTTVTDFEGHYEFTHLAPGSYNLEASVEGFQRRLTGLDINLSE